MEALLSFPVKVKCFNRCTDIDSVQNLKMNYCTLFHVISNHTFVFYSVKYKRNIMCFSFNVDSQRMETSTFQKAQKNTIKYNKSSPYNFSATFQKKKKKRCLHSSPLSQLSNLIYGHICSIIFHISDVKLGTIQLKSQVLNEHKHE